MKAKQIVKETPGAVLANQFYNWINPEGTLRHYGAGDLGADRGRVTHSGGWGGHRRNGQRGGKYLKEKNPRVRVVAGDPVGSLYTHYHRTRFAGDPVTLTRWRESEGDKIPTHHLVRFDRRVSPGPRSNLPGDGAPAGPGGGNPGRRIHRPQRGPGAGTAPASWIIPTRSSSPSCAIPASATSPRSSTTSGCRRTRCSSRRGPRSSSCWSGGTRRPTAGQRGAGGGRAPGAQPDEHLGRESDPRGRGRAVGRWAGRGHV